MKRYLYYFSLFLIIVIGFGMNSCSKEYKSPLKGKSLPDVTFSAGQSTNTISVGVDDLSAFSIVSNENWCKATTSKNVIILDLQANETYGERQASITIIDSEDGTSISFKVIQKQNNAILTDQSTYTIAPEGGELTIDIKSNVTYVIDWEYEEWLKIEEVPKTRGLETTKIIVKANKNNSKYSRNALITLKDKDNTVTSSFQIKQDIFPYLDIDKKEISIDNGYALFDLNINTNIDYTIETSESWISRTNNEIVNDSITIEKFYCGIKLMVYPEKVRTGSVIIKNLKYNIKREVPVTQTSLFQFEIKDAFDIKVGESLDLNKYLYNITGKNVAWLVGDKSIATVDNNGIIKGIKKGQTSIFACTEKNGLYNDLRFVNVIEEKKADNNINKKIKVEYVNSGIYTIPSYASWIELRISNLSNNNIIIKRLMAYKTSGECFSDKTYNDQININSSNVYEVIKEQALSQVPENYFLYNSFELEIYYINLQDNEEYKKKVKVSKSLMTSWSIVDIS